MDWASIAGGRCQGEPWRVGIAGVYSGPGGEAFLLGDEQWTRLQALLPLSPLQIYGNANGLRFERVAASDTQVDYDAVLLIEQVPPGMGPLTLSAGMRRYLMLLEQSMEADRLCRHFDRVFLPAQEAFLGQHLIRLNQPLELPLVDLEPRPAFRKKAHVFGRDDIALEQAHFALCDADAELAGWLSPQWQSCLLSGVVPVKTAAAPIPKWFPHDCYVDGTVFANEVKLSAFLDGMAWSDYEALAVRLRSFLMQGSARPDERIYPYTVDFWINALTSVVALDASEVRGQELLLSVVIPAFNYARYLEQAVRSLLTQGIDSIEVLVLDNASTDDTQQVMTTFAGDTRVRYMRNRRNFGAGNNSHNGFWVAKGKYLILFMADDFMNPGHVSRLLPAMEEDARIAVGYSPICWVNEQGKPLKGPRHPGHRQADYVGGRNEVADLLVYDNYITPSAAIIRREAFFQAWQRDIRIRGAGDWQLMVQLGERFPDFVFTTTPGVSYRVHGAQHSNEYYGTSEPLEGHLCIVEGVFERGSERLLKGRERDVAEHLRRRMEQYPNERGSQLGGRVRSLCERLEGLARQSEDALFSIILTTYNRPGLLKDALASVGNQTLRDFEVILINDNGEPVEHLLADYDFPITYIRQGRNQGLSAARNTGLKSAKGRYVTYLDDDDIYLPDHLAVLAEVFEQYSNTVVYTGVEYVSELLEDGKRVEVGRSQPLKHETFDRDRLFVQNYIPVNTWAHPRAMLAAAGEFDIGLTAFEDWDMLLRLATRYAFVHVASVTTEVHIRVPGAGSDHMLAREQKNFAELYRKIYKRHGDLESASVRESQQAMLAQLEAGKAPDHFDAIQHWMSYRTLSPVQQEFVDDYLREQSGGPRIGLLLLDRVGDRAAVEQTLASLKRQHYSHVVIGLVTALATDQPLLEHWPDTVLRLAAPDQAAEVLNRLAGQMETDWYLQLQAGETLTNNGLLICALELIGAPDCRAIYADQLQRSAEGRQEIVLRPDFNLDFLLNFPRGMASHWLVRQDVFLAAGGYNPQFSEAMEFDLILRLLESGGMAGLGHVAEPLLITKALQAPPVEHELQALQRHLAVRGYEQAEISRTAPGCYHIAYRHEAQPLVSIIILMQDPLALVQRCVMSVLEHTSYPYYELLILDNASTDPAASAWLCGIEQMDTQQIRVLRIGEPLSRAMLLNQAALRADGEYLLLLSPTCAALHSDWLDELLNQALRPEVGIVGGKTVSDDKKITHAGQLLGLQGVVGRAFLGASMDDPGYMSRLWVAQNYSAVSEDCFMVRRSLYLEMGGLDEGEFADRGAELDLCLRVTQANYLIVWTPHAVLLNNQLPEPESAVLQDAFYARWLPRLARDPAYNPNFSLVRSPAGFALTDYQLAWKPLVWRPLPVILAHNADNAGCGHYRIIQPFNALQEAGLVEGVLSIGLMHVTDLERYDPDVIVLQRQIGEDRLEAMRRMKAFSRAFKVYELDDYLPNLPVKSVHRQHMPKDIFKSLRRGLAYVDRFVVSTDVLAEAFSGLHAEIQVAYNRLDPRWWSDLTSIRRRTDKPRVGWAGGAGHTGDLEMVADVIEALSKEVDWIFLGMCPEKLRPFVKEYHPGVAIDQYPRKLAQLDLDLAIAPVEQNLFNECKSNLRLLEYGVCGFPVICSDIRCYEGDLPVTRVKNRFRDWMEAIRSHINDLDAAAKRGDELQRAVKRDWMLEGQNLQLWKAAWLP